MIPSLRTAPASRLRGTVLVRLDFNTKEEWRMAAAVPTLKFLRRHASKMVVVSHRGRPRGREATLTLWGKAHLLGKLIGRPVHFIPHFRFSAIKREIERAPKGSVFLLENLRFLRGEGTNDPKLARALASLADYYVNDAFAVSHRANASVSAITKFLPSYAGFGLEKEINMLSSVFAKPKHPFVMVIGGGKVDDKLGILTRFRERVDCFLIGGIAANTLLYLKGVKMDGSAIDRSRKHRLVFQRVGKFPNLIIPIDWRSEKGRILDIGEKTTKLFAEKIESAKTILWNGPMGFIEDPRFIRGSVAVAKAIGKNRKALSVSGGGETVMFLKKYKLDRGFKFVSTGGGAMLELLAGKKLPGVEALKR